MVRIRLRVAFPITLALALVALLGMGSCASPTQIVLTIYTNACPGGTGEAVQSTGVAVGTAEDIDAQLPSSTKVGCEASPRIGTITIYPSGSKTDEVAIKVLGGVELAPDRCIPPGYAGCIVDRRMMRFVPNVTQRVTINLSLACLNRQCPSGTTCSDGACVSDHDVLADGGTVDDATVVESGPVAPLVDASSSADATTIDPCAGCAGVCDGTSCVVDCNVADCSKSLCAPTLPCTINCNQPNQCRNVSCKTTSECTINCSMYMACGAVSCMADTCNVNCKADFACQLMPGGITVTGTTQSTVDCDGNNACRNGPVSCTGGVCTLMCSPKNQVGNGPASTDACPNNVSCMSAVPKGCDGWKSN